MADQLNASLSIAAHKIDELSQERDLLLADKALLTQAVITRITLLCPQLLLSLLVMPVIMKRMMHVVMLRESRMFKINKNTLQWQPQ